jgi:predicted permease
VLLVKVPVEFGPGMITRNLKLAGPLYERLNALPGVRSAAIASLGPLADFQQTAPIALPERPSREGEYVRIVHVSPRFFETMGIRVQAGRAITAADRSGAPKIGVLSETAVKELFRGGNPLGRLISMTRRYDPAAAIEVVGVAHDIRYSSMREPFGMLIYVPLDQSPAPITSLALHVDGDPARYVAPVVAVVHELDSGLKLGDMLPVGQVADSTLGQERMLAFLSACFGLLAVTLASVGLYGVVSYAVAHRTPEIGIRMALGAGRGGVTALLMKDVLGLLAAGLALGGAASVATTHWIRSLLFGLNPADPGMWLGAAALLGVMAVVSGAIPASRAARLDPMDALRLE